MVQSLNLIKVLTNDEYADCKYKIQDGVLYLLDGTKRDIQINIENPGIYQGVFDEIKDLFFELIDQNDHEENRDSPLSTVVMDLIKEKFKQNHNQFRNKEDMDSYSKSLGMTKLTIDEKELPDLLEKSENLFDVKQLCAGLLSSDGIRKIVAETLKSQEDSILEQIPQEYFADPDALRGYFVDFLNEKGLSYDDAVAQFNWGQGKPQKDAIEGSYVLAKLIAQVDAWKILRSKKNGENFPFQDVWRFCIDGSKEKYGAYFFENEPFYILSSLRGLKDILESHDKPSLETYERYAAALMQNPPILKGNRFLKDNSLDLSPVNANNHFFGCKAVKGSHYFDSTIWKNDDIGLSDLHQRSLIREQAEERLKRPNIEISDKDYWIANATGFEKDMYHIASRINTTNNIVSKRIFLGLEQLLEKAKTPGERLIAYIWAARELEVTHQLEDGNGRTSINFLIKCIFDDPDLPIYITEDPNILDMQGPEALLRDVYSGMQRFNYLSGGNPDEIKSVETLLDESGVRGQGWDVIHKLAELPEEVITRLVAEDKETILRES